MFQYTKPKGVTTRQTAVRHDLVKCAMLVFIQTFKTSKHLCLQLLIHISQMLTCVQLLTHGLQLLTHGLQLLIPLVYSC